MRDRAGWLALESRTIPAPALRPVVTLSAIPRRLAAFSFGRRPQNMARSNPPKLPVIRTIIHPAGVVVSMSLAMNRKPALASQAPSRPFGAP